MPILPANHLAGTNRNNAVLCCLRLRVGRWRSLHLISFSAPGVSCIGYVRMWQSLRSHSVSKHRRQCL